MSQGKDNARLKSYKNKSLNTDEMRRRREEEGLQLRKQKKDEQVRQIDIRWQDESLELILDGCNVTSYGTCWYLLSAMSLFLQLFKRRNVATVEEDGALEDDGMSDSGYLESQANNMDQITVRHLNTILSWRSCELSWRMRFTVLTYILLNRKLGHWMACL